MRKTKTLLPGVPYPAWTPLEHAGTTTEKVLGGTVEIWGNSRYTVIVRSIGNGPFGPMTHLSIHDHWRTARHDWRDFQRIKNEICGEESEAIELYPPESQKVDMANQFHLWVFPSDTFSFTKMGICWRQGRMVSEGQPFGDGRQRPFGKDIE